MCMMTSSRFSGLIGLGRISGSVSQWLCAEHYDEHMETRGFLHMDGENLDAQGNPL
jgi:hypothetical protein